MVPTVRGKALDRRAWIFPSLFVVVDAELGQQISTLLLRDVEREIWPQAVAFWPEAVATRLVSDLAKATQQLFRTLARIVDFKDIPELDALGERIVRRELESIGQAVGAALSEACERYSELVDIVEQANGDLPEDFAVAADEFRRALTGTTSGSATEYQLSVEQCERWLADLEQRGLVGLEMLRLVVWAHTIPDRRDCP